MEMNMEMDSQTSSNMDMNTDCSSMPMYFYTSTDVAFLLQGLETTYKLNYFVGLFVIVILCATQEFVNYFRYWIAATQNLKYVEENKRLLCLCSQESVLERMSHFTWVQSPNQLLLYLVDVILSYGLMLLVMTFNLGIFITIVLSYTVLQFFFFRAWKAIDLKFLEILEELQQTKVS